jgi:midasin (ATPase involved in ribosome maturation)
MNMDVEEPIQAHSFQLNLVEALKTVARVCDQNSDVTSFCERFLALDHWTSANRIEILEQAAQWLLDSTLTLKVANSMRSVVEELVFLARRGAKFATGVHPVTGISTSTEYNIRFSSALSRLCRVSPACLTLAKVHFGEFDALRPIEAIWPLLQRFASEGETTKAAHASELLVEVLRTTWRLVKLTSFPINQAALLNVLQKCNPSHSQNEGASPSMNASEPQPMTDILQRVYILASQALSHSLGISDSEMQSIPSFLQAQHSSYLAMVDEEDSGEYQLMLASSSWIHEVSPSASSGTGLTPSIGKIGESPSRFVTVSDLQSGLVEVAGFLLQSNPNPATHPVHRPRTLVVTPTTSHNLEALALAIGNEKPVLLLGPTGSGKTALIQHVASLVKRELTTIHIGEALDGKNLLGGYVATEVPGQFKWVEGPLTRAVSQGHWLVIEDLDMASPEVYGILQPLVQSRQLFIPSRAETIHADHGFSLFATATTAHSASTASKSSSGAATALSLAKLQQSSFWTKVVIDPLESAELTQVIESGFSLGQLAPLLVSTHESLVTACSKEGISLRATERTLTTRDVLRWAKRTRDALFASMSASGIPESDVLAFLAPGRALSSGLREMAVKEALDVYLAPAQHASLVDARCAILASAFQLTNERLDYLRRNRPALETNEKSCFVGRACIPVNTNPKTLAPPLATLREVFVPTSRSLGLLEWLAMASQHLEPVLLVGETGGGKTSTIQHLAARTRRKLVVLNMSQSSDTVDLLGGFKPVDLSMLATPLKRIFDRVFVKTFSKTKNQEFIDRVHQAHSVKDWRTLATLLAKACKLANTKFEQRRQQEATEKAAAAAAVSGPEMGSPPATREVKRRKTDDLEPEALRQAFAAFDDLDADTFPTNIPLEQQWNLYTARIQRFGVQVDGVKAFQYVEGALVKAVQKGEWVLLDEINLASAETLECLSGLLEGDSLVLSERGDLEAIPRHPDFRLFAAMNPANDVGKSNLPAALRARFSEFYLSELEDRDDLAMIVQGYLSRVNPKPPSLAIVDFYLAARKEAETRLVDGSNQKPRFNLRSLSRSLEYCADTTNLYGFDRALFEGIQLAFLTQLNTASYDLMSSLIQKHIRTKTLTDKVLKTPPSVAHFQRNFGTSSSSSGVSDIKSTVTFEQFMLQSGPQEPFKDPRFIVTQTTQKHLTHLARALTTRKYPLLLQGPTSAGKTSMIEYLAKLTGHRFVRVNNSDQTDLQEYLGQYIHDAQGRLVYHDGVLVEALRHGHWIVLDELNLAPSEVLEALNRLLDDNRQLYVPELQEYITPHPHFCLFATQNPPGLYGGRKVLSRAFRSRFLELHIDDIPDAELQLILEQRSHLPASYCQKLVVIMKDLQRQRQGTQVFAGRHGFVTLRDLFRWAERHPTSYDELAIHGYFLLADRLREQEEREIVKQVLEKHLKVNLNLNEIYESIWRKAFGAGDDSPIGQHSIVWTAATKRLFGLMSICLRHKEPILLVGPPGTGKTAISQLHAELLSQHIEILNCHQNSEAADFIGGLRPVRGKDSLQLQLISSLSTAFDTLRRLLPADICQSVLTLAFNHMALDQEQSNKLNTDIERLKTETTSMPSASLDRLMNLIPRLKMSLAEFKASVSPDAHTSRHSLGVINQKLENCEEKYSEYTAMFTWYDGPLVRTMKRGQIFLVDEISLAEDAVLERLNSVLEPSRLLVLAEKGGREIEELIAHPDFRIISTMNPGGDFGKKELSPALRNRFTEIFVPAVDQREDLIHIIEKRLSRYSGEQHDLSGYASSMVDFLEFFLAKTNGAWSFSLRDILAWADFLVTTADQLGPHGAYHHGASMLIIDGLGITNPLNADTLKKLALDFLGQQSLPLAAQHPEHALLPSSKLHPELLVNEAERFGLGTFTLSKAPSMDIAKSEAQLESYSMKAPTTLSNLLRLLRALQLPKPLLLEGSPGVGKTTIVEALAAACGRKVARINLSEQTDMLDLLGADLPVEDDVSHLENASEVSAPNTAKFEWRDGVFLNALKNGDWVLLDELNLANQSVLEGLNAVLDHRGTVFIPELNTSFVCPPTFRIFAAQNPTAQGGGRKGLPKSFLNRFTKVYLDTFSFDDLTFIANALFPEIGATSVSQMVEFNTQVYKATMETFTFGRDGAPWEFNLRDILRWCKLVKTSAEQSPDAFVQLLYMQRFRTHADRLQVSKLFEKCFGRPLRHATNNPFYQITQMQLQVGNALLPRTLRPTPEPSHAGHHGAAMLEDQPPFILQHLLPAMESLMKCVEFNWLAILVGPTASGKSSLLKLLAWLTGNRLSTFSVNPSVDTLEILGGFEQIDLNRHAKKILQRMGRFASLVIRMLLKSNTASDLDDACHLASMWQLFQEQAQTTSNSGSSFSGKSLFASDAQQRLTTQLLDLLDVLITKLSPEDLALVLETDSTSSLRVAVTKIGVLEAKSVAGSFEWVDGLLLEAMENGHWIVLDNVNTCPGPVLDRLLPLLEPNGLIRLNERGLVDGQVAEIKPHPNFRIFFTMDPKFGDISRAMRNRGIEIAMTPIPTETGTVDLDRLLSRSLQLHSPVLFERMAKFHNSISPQRNVHGAMLPPTVINGVSLPVDPSLGLCDLIHWAELSLDQMQRGESLASALSLAMEQVYVRGQSSAEVRSLLRLHFGVVMADLDLGSHSEQLQQQLLNTPGFIDRLNMLSPQAVALSMLTHSQAILGMLAAPIAAGKPSIFALEHLVRACATHWSHHWVTSLRAFMSSHGSVLLDSADDQETWSEMVGWAMTQFGTSEVVAAAQVSVTACLDQLLRSGDKDAAAWLALQSAAGTNHAIRHNVPLWRLLFKLASRDEASWQIYCTACADLDRVRLWCQTLPHQLNEMEVVKAISNKAISAASVSSLSLVEQSIAITYRKISKASASHPLATLLASFFSELDTVLSQFVGADALTDAHVKTFPSKLAQPCLPIVQELQLVLSLRHHLWRWLLATPGNAFLARDFVPPFNWLMKELGKFDSLPISDSLKVIVSHMNKIVHDELGAKYKPTLWKQEGHPLPLKNTALFQLQSQLNALDVSAKSSLRESHSTVLRAMSTLMFLNTLPVGGPAQSQIDSLFQSISNVPQMVTETLSNQLDLFGDVAGSSQRDADQQSELKNPMLEPLFDHRILQLEMYVIQQVQQSLAQFHTTRQIPNIGAEFAHLVPVLNQIIDLSIANTTTAARLQAGYQLLLWIIDSNGATVVKSSSKVSANHSDPSATFLLLQSVFSELKATFGERQLYNATSTATISLPPKREGGVFLPPVVIENQKKAKAQDLNRREMLDFESRLEDVATPRVSNDQNAIRLESAYRTAYTMARLNEWKHVPVVMKQMRMDQMEKLVSFLSSSLSAENDQVVQADGAMVQDLDWKYLADTLVITMQSFGNGETQLSNLSQFGSSLRALLNSGQLIPQQTLDLQVAMLAEVSSTTADARFSEVGPNHVPQIVALLTKVCTYATSFWTSLKDIHAVKGESLPADSHMRLLEEPTMRQWRAQFQLELTFLRAALLLPSQPIDISTKYASRATIIEHMREEVATRLSILVRAESSFTGSGTNYEIEQEKLILERLDQLLTAARERQVSRPESAPSFHVLWSQLQAVFQAHCHPGRYRDLVKGLLTVRQMPRSMVVTQWPALLLQEAQFQNNLTQAVTDLQTKFYAYYPDVVAPLLNCVYDLKSALRSIRFSSELMMPSSLLLGTYSMDSVSSMMNELQLQQEEKVSRTKASEMTINLHAPALSCSADSMYALSSHLQQVISKLAQVPRSLSQGDVSLILSSTTFEAVTALARLNQARAQAALVDAHSHSLTKGSNVDAKIRQWMLSASRTSSVLQLQSSLLRASLDAVFAQARAQGYISQESYDSLDRIFTVFVETYQAAQAELEKKRAAEAEFYKYKTQSTTIEHQHDVEETNFRSMFPDYYMGFEDILGKIRDKPIDPHAPVQQVDDEDAEGEEAYKIRQAEEEAAANSPAVMFQGQIYELTDGEIYQLCRIHFKVFSVLRTYLQPGVQELMDATAHDELEELEAAIASKSKKRAKNAKNSQNAQSSAAATSAAAAAAAQTARWKRQTEERQHNFMSAYETAAKVAALLGELLPRGSQDSALEAAHIIALQQCMDQLTANWRNPEKSAPGVSKKQSKQRRLAARQRRLEAAKSAVVTSFMSSHELVPNFYTAPNAGEASLLQEPLSAFQQRLEDLLAMEEIGENQILITLWKLVTRLLEADVSLPLMHFVTGLELLIDRSQDWDLYQPARFGIREHMNACAKFVTRWRAMELQFWPQLLTSKEQQFQLRASKWWFFLYSLLHDTAAKCHQQPIGELMDQSDAMEVDERSSSSSPDFAGLLSALQEYIEQSTYGEFPTRLHLLVSFYYQFQAEFDLRGNLDDRRNALVTMLYNVYRYYAQFLPLLQAEIFKLKEATQLKLEDFIKISKWDDSTFYRLRKTTEASHRNLNKFTKQYENEVLALPFRNFLEMIATNEKLEQLKKETVQVTIVSGVKLGSNAAASSASSVASKTMMQSLSEMNARCQQLIIPTNAFDAKIFENTPQFHATDALSVGASEGLYSRLSQLFARVSKHSSKLLPTQFEFAHRSHIQLERLTTELIEGILEMRTVAETPMKKRAFAGMLQELKSIGLDHHKTAVKAVLKQQTLVASATASSALVDVNALHDIATLFSEPICEPIVSKLLLVAAEQSLENSSSASSRVAAASNERSVNLLTDSLDTFWAKSDDYFYKVLAQVLLLRSAEQHHSPQLSRGEALKSLGFSDHVFALLIHQRRTMAIALERHEKAEKISSVVGRLFEDFSPSSGSGALPHQASLRLALVHQKADLDAFLATTTSIVDLAHTLTTVAGNGLSRSNNINSLLDAAKEALLALTAARNEVDGELSAQTEIASLSRVAAPQSPLSCASLVLGPRSYQCLMNSDHIIEENLSKLSLLIASAVPRLSPDIVRIREQRTLTLRERAPQLTFDLQAAQSSTQMVTGNVQMSKFSETFLTSFNAAIESLLLAVQKVYKLEKLRKANEKQAVETRQKEVETHKASLEEVSRASSERESLRRPKVPSGAKNGSAMDVTVPAGDGDTDDMPPEHVFDPQAELARMSKAYMDDQLTTNDRFLPLHLVDAMNHLDALTVALNAPTILSHFSTACSLLSGYIDANATSDGSSSQSEREATIRACTTLLQQFNPLLKQWTSLHLAHVHNRALLCKSSAKFSHVLVSVLASIMKDGFCIQPKNSGDGAVEEGETQNLDGMGLGEGTGENDVTDRYDEEEQLLGDKPLKDMTKDENGAEKEDPASKPPVDPDTGAEMENDFEGEMRDVEQKDSPDQDDSENEADDKDDEDLMDREMGDMDPEQEEVLDERLWNEDDETDDEGKDGPQGKESYEKNAPLEENAHDEAEMEARLDDETTEPPPSKRKPDASQKSKDGDEGDEGDEEGDAASEAEGDAPERDEAGGDEDPVHNQEDDRYEDSHNPPPRTEEEEFELPEDMNLDGEDKAQEEQQGGMDVDEEEPAPEGSNDDESAAKPFPEQPDEPEPAKEPETADAEANADDKNESGENNENDAEPEEADAAGGGAQALDGDEEDSNEAPEETPEEDGEREKVGQSRDDGKSYDEAFGVTDDPHLPQQQNVKTTEDRKSAGGGQDDSNQAQAPDQNADPTSQASAGGAGSSSARPTPAPNPSSDKPDAAPQPPAEARQAPTQQKDANPMRSLGDALKHWERQLNVIEDRTDQSDAPEDAPAPMDDMNGDKNQNFEFAREHEQADQQTLGIASEEQAEKFKQEDHTMALQNEEEEQPKEETQKAEKMDVDETPLDPEQNTTVESKARAPSNRLQTQNDAMQDQSKTDMDSEAKPDDSEAQTDEADKEATDENLVPSYESVVSKPSTEKEPFEMDVDESAVSQEIAALTPEDLLSMRQHLEETLAVWKSDPSNVALGGEIWRQLQAITSGAAQQLCEQLRLLLEPTLKSKMQGDYRTGKRLNMRRVVTYVASQFRKDKIWLRRTQPNKRTYQVLLCLDDSQSVLLGNAAPLMREATATLCLALQRLQIGQLALLKFGNKVDLLHPFSTPFTDEAAAVVMPQLAFEQQTTNMESLMRTSIQMLELSRHEAVMSMGSSSATTMQLMFVIGDGRFGDKRQELANWLHRAQQNNIFVVFLIMDTLDKDQSILDIQSVASGPGGKITITPYIDDFPFAYYIILKHLDNLPHILSDALRQWFEMINQGDRK